MTDIVPVNQNLPVTYSPADVLDGDESSNSDQLALPSLRIVHGTSQLPGASKHIGEWYNGATNNYAKELEAVLLVCRDARTLFNPNIRESGRPECQSRDGINGTFYGPCAQCDFNTDVHRELWDAPQKRCNRGYYLIFFLPSTGAIVTYIAMKTNTRPITGLRGKIKAALAPIYGMRLTLKIKPESDGKREWYVIDPVVGDALRGAELDKMRQLSRALRASAARAAVRYQGASQGVVVEEPERPEEDQPDL